MNAKLKGEKIIFKDSDFVTAQGCNPPHPDLDCVAVAIKNGVVAVRSTHDKNKRTVRFHKDEWRNFIIAVKAGGFGI